MLIIENFIPHEEKSKITNRAYFDEDEDTWKLQALTKQGYVQGFLNYFKMYQVAFICTVITVQSILSD